MTASHEMPSSNTKNIAEISKKLFGVSEITPWLYLCGAPALSTETMTSLDVKLIVSAAPELPPPPAPGGVTTVQLDILDIRDPKAIAAHLNPVADIIHQVGELDGGVVLVHCVAGVSRSATLCLAYLVKYRSMSLKEAFLSLRIARPSVRPNPAFFKALIEFEQEVRPWCEPSVSMVYNSAAGPAPIPDIYEPLYINTIKYHNRSCGAK